MERLTYVAENGEVLFHPADLPDDEGITITQLAKDGRYKALEEIAERLANREQAEKQGLLLRLIEAVTILAKSCAFTHIEAMKIAKVCEDCCNRLEREGLE